MNREKMKRFTDAIAKAVTDQNWLAATALALTMPDVCGGMEHPKHKSTKRYKAWWDKYMLKHYPALSGAPELSGGRALSGADAYDLRCAYLHEGRLTQRARERVRKTLTRIHFVVPEPKRGLIPRRRAARQIRNVVGSARSRGNKVRFLEVDDFCKKTIEAVDRWSNDVSKDQAVQKRLQSLLEIHELPTT
jgi:hypothetical protein